MPGSDSAGSYSWSRPIQVMTSQWLSPFDIMHFMSLHPASLLSDCAAVRVASARVLAASRAYSIGCAVIEPVPFSAEYDAIVPARTLDAHVAVEHVVEHSRRVAFERVPPAAAPAELESPERVEIEWH